MSRFFERVSRRQKHFADPVRREHAIVLLPGVPLRVHAVNGGYLFSIYQDESGLYRYDDKRWGKTGTKAEKLA